MSASLAFPVPALAFLPRAQTVRPTAVAQRLMEKAGLLTFGSLLRALSFPAWNALEDKSPDACYTALVHRFVQVFRVGLVGTGGTSSELAQRISAIYADLERRSGRLDSIFAV